MKKNKLKILAVVAILACFTMAPALVLAEGEVILPVSGNNDSVTISIFQSGEDVTDTWLPEPEKEVEIIVNGAANVTSIVLVPKGPADPISSMTTSAYPGTCTNFGEGDEQDFDLPSANILLPHDNGGMAVVSVTGSVDSGATFENLYIIPADSDLDGIADNYERLHCQNATCLTPNEDDDIGPEMDTTIGDAISARDEYRGFRVSENYIRTHPRVKDVFVNFLDDAQCLGEADLTDGHGLPISLDTFYDEDNSPPYDYPDFESLFVNMNTLIPNIFVHRIKSEEWVDHFYEYTDEGGVILVGNTLGEQEQNAIWDRQINKNALYPKGRLDPVSGMAIMKGIRLIQCLKTDVSMYGLSPKRPPDGFEIGNGTAVIYPQQIWKDFKAKFWAGEGWGIQYYTFYDRRWREVAEFGPAPEYPNDNFDDFIQNEGVRFIMKDVAFPFYVAHEALGHSLDLTSTIEGTDENPVGYHHVAGTGTNIDIRIVHVVKRANKFYIPKYFGVSDKVNMHLLEETQP